MRRKGLFLRQIHPELGELAGHRLGPAAIGGGGRGARVEDAAHAGSIVTEDGSRPVLGEGADPDDKARSKHGNA